MKDVKKYQLDRYHRLRNEVIILLGGKCKYCSSKENLEIDHINRTSKIINIGKIFNLSLNNIMNEANKCQILCNKCHLKKTILERGDNIALGTHGTLSSYKYCKCDLCKIAKKEWMASYYKNNKRIIKNGKRIIVRI